MKKGLFVVLVILVFTQIAAAQTIKTGVLVIGNGNNAIGSGFQSAISGVKTIMLVQGADLVVTPPDRNISSGLESLFFKKMRLAKGIQDSSSKVYVDETSANAVLKNWGDSIKNLTMLKNIKWSRIKRSGNNWNVLLEDGRNIKAEVLVNADGSGNVTEALGLKGPIMKQWLPLSYSNNLYRISVSAGVWANKSNANVILLDSFLLPNQENLVVLNPENESLAAGQAAGATAAYAVFFRTKTSLSALKPIQKELINHGLAVMPFADVLHQDPNWKPIQVVGLAGFLKAGFVNGEAHFYPEQEVSTDEVKAPLKEFYYKAQIWFDDYKETNMTLGAVLNLVCMVGNKSPETTKAEVQKKWSSRYQFKNEFDLNRSVTRREFAVLVDEYLSPFTVNIDKAGRVIR